MLTFLDDVAKKILQSNEKLDRIRIIVPSIRAIKFLKEAFKKNLKKPIFAPEIISIESFIEELSGIKKINSQELHFVFYSIYQKLTPVDEQNSL
ncbi:MAG TPA: PD-(D/E)XK nuclease family protein, partial [Flavobacteriaceae bacterium]|nr:PD-(D/E)XK nuclease family protein [Flavobacteriaceae bacterium]